MPRILYSPGYGAGWTTWHYGTSAERRFMLTYRPLIEAIENRPADVSVADHVGLSKTGRDCVPGSVLDRFRRDWIERFGEDDLPYLGGVHHLAVAEVDAERAFRITEYDGYESIEYPHEDDYYVLSEDAIDTTASEVDTIGMIPPKV